MEKRNKRTACNDMLVFKRLNASSQTSLQLLSCPLVAYLWDLQTVRRLITYFYFLFVSLTLCYALRFICTVKSQFEWFISMWLGGLYSVFFKEHFNLPLSLFSVHLHAHCNAIRVLEVALRVSSKQLRHVHVSHQNTLCASWDVWQMVKSSFFRFSAKLEAATLGWFDSCVWARER